jgi:hypothetical protein
MDHPLSTGLRRRSLLVLAGAARPLGALVLGWLVAHGYRSVLRDGWVLSPDD